ncbi:NADH pyrophosphatase [Xenorhabdus bovienii str. Jollieti]|uniref:NAD-capped RNA hydrolase NudC n=1 Tax=Xenorhabdus bovienii (strain SS-2004) TaxID=406818 RepID=D3V658_XENBS|nr:NAD(+) diphosphatase [Xenorhabdus bovienii]CBJ83137.1 NADH pyrophosphatase [Xenorhabdus bovienii SS-2004]CDH28860.1 NADH pyrophosphatase [Xenorhabdus bovienii str. Jollieti]
MIQQKLTGMERGWWVISLENLVWLPQGELPSGTARQWSLQGHMARPIGEWLGETVWLVCQKMASEMASPRMVVSQHPKLFQLVGRGVQLAEFYRSHHYCGYCGHEMQHSQHEWACLCNHCHERYYPQIAPCVIVGIRRDDHILLAQHQSHRNGIHTVLAGFVEVGEMLEEAAHREVMEESGIKIRNLRYVASQPWPFPQSLMMGFLADYDSGEIQHDPVELISADWYRYDDLPLIPQSDTIARRLIEETVALCRNM